MRRDVGNEVTVAIAALGVLAFALTFAIILSLTSSNPNIARETRVLLATWTDAPATANNVDASPTGPGEAVTATSPLRPTPTQWLPSNQQPQTSNALQVTGTATVTPTETGTATVTATSTSTATATTEMTETAEVTPEATETEEATATAEVTPEATETEEATATVEVTPTVTSTATATSTDTETTTPTDTATATPSETETSTATATDTATPTETATNTPSETPTDRATHTPSDTPTDTETATDMPTDTETATDMPTDTATPTDTPSDTPTSTDTPVPTATLSDTPTDTPMPTDTPVPTATPSDTPTDTPVPTETFTPSDTPSDTPTATVDDIGILPTPTAFAPLPTEATFEAQAAPAVCEPPEGWEVYRVQSGNTLFSIARAVESTVGELRDANCLLNVDNIFAGDLLYVPRLPTEAVVTGVPAQYTPLPPEIISSLTPLGCSDPTTVITSPYAGQQVGEVFTVFGTAWLENLDYYKIEVRPGFSEVYNFYASYEDGVIDGALGQVNTNLFEDGLHWIRLTTVDDSGNFPQPCAIPVIFP